VGKDDLLHVRQGKPLQFTHAQHAAVEVGGAGQVGHAYAHGGQVIGRSHRRIPRGFAAVMGAKDRRGKVDSGPRARISFRESRPSRKPVAKVHDSPSL
jgi:hypothetical protein